MTTITTNEEATSQGLDLTAPHSLIAPHGGSLRSTLVAADRAEALRTVARDGPSWTLTPRQRCDFEMLTTGALSPLTGFLDRRDYESVRDDIRLADGTLWPIPVTLDVSEAVAERATAAATLALRDDEGVLLGVLHIADAWRADQGAEAEGAYGTTDPDHPGVAQLRQLNPVYLGGTVESVQLPEHHDYRSLRHDPAALRRWFTDRGWHRVVAFQTRNPMHRAHFELTRRAAASHDARLLIHPPVCQSKPGDVDHFTRVRGYQALLPRYGEGRATLSLLPLAMRMAGPREALWHAIIRKNYGASHFIVGRDHAGPGSDPTGEPYYEPYAAQELVRDHAAELGITMVPFQRMVYAPARDRFIPVDEAAPDEVTRDLSGTELRQRLRRGDDVPSWFTFPEVADHLRRRHPPRHRHGFTVFFTGLSGAGKSTVAQALIAKLLERDHRAVTLLDGDHVRHHLSSELGFSKEHRDLNIRRIGFVAAAISRSGGISVCAPIAPYDATRKAVRADGEAGAGFVLVHVATPLAVCEARDRKGLYAKARAGQIAEFTGISDPYEAPEDADLVLDTSALTVDEAADRVLAFLRDEGYLRDAEPTTGPPGPPGSPS